MTSVTMTGEFEEDFDRLKREVLWLHGHWDTSKRLFAGNEARVDLLNHIAPDFFSRIQGVLVEGAILGVCRLLDPVGRGKRRNLVLESLVLHVREQDLCFAGRLELALEEVWENASAMRRVRNKVIAHSDRATKIGRDVDPLPDVKFEDMDSVLDGMAGFLNAIQIEYTEIETAYDYAEDHLGVEALVWALKRGAHFKDMASEDGAWHSKLRESKWGGC